jgi:hypothetical protein
MSKSAVVVLSVFLFACGDDDAGARLADAAGAAIDAAGDEVDGAAAADAADPDANPGCHLLDGDAEPQDDGWTVTGSVTSADTVVAEGGMVVIDTAGDTNTVTTSSGAPYVLFSRDAGATDFVLSFRLDVTSGTHNPSDAGVAVMPAFTAPFGITAERDFLVYFEADEIGWGDESDSEAVDLGDGPHAYELEVDGANLTLRMDGADLLTRTDYPGGNGLVTFGDQSNDPGVDGHFAIDDVALDCAD